MEIKVLLVLFAVVFVVSEARYIRGNARRSDGLTDNKKELAELIVRALLDSRQDEVPPEGSPDQGQQPPPPPQTDDSDGVPPDQEAPEVGPADESPVEEQGGPSPQEVGVDGGQGGDEGGPEGEQPEEGPGEQGQTPGDAPDVKDGEGPVVDVDEGGAGIPDNRDPAVGRALLRAALNRDITDRQADDILDAADDIGHYEDPDCQKDGFEETEGGPEGHDDHKGKDKGKSNGNKKEGESTGNEKEDSRKGDKQDSGRGGDRQGNSDERPKSGGGQAREIYDLLERILEEM